MSGFDLLGYGDERRGEGVIEGFVEEKDLGVCVGGSMDS